MSYRNQYADAIERQFCDLENRIIADIIRRIKKTGEITSTADWQVNKLTGLGYSSDDIESAIKNSLKASWPDMFELYDHTIEQEYTRNKKVYEQINGKFVPYKDNAQLRQWTESAKDQTKGALQNLTRTLGVAVSVNGQLTFLPLTEAYKKLLDAAVMDITSGAFDYNSVLKRTVSALSNSGIRTIDYASGYSSRIAVVARRAVLTGASQLAGRISDMNAEKLGTEYFEVSHHSGARPSHRRWQGKVYTREQLVTICGLGKVDGLKGANCYHDYYPFIPGVSKRQYSDKWLAEQNHREDQPKTFQGKGYTAYEAKQQQRKLETSMRAQRQKVRGLQQGKGSPDDIINEKARYQGQLQEYKRFSTAMGLKPQMDRVYIDGLGRIAPGNMPKNI
ncbi:phage minor capsid protein [Clostridiales Family XIII bacterium ASD5510]|uniref:Phage minor capsid protein n=1 Tax=Hominibacterium faecale TaxID=2839743 RepID=A0A9J6QZ82_9FIRM|nr:phage minor capsid protein [Hominibacterium faecale]MCU7380843.1 phage minor capsid protein [Hominibacterium faecale]